MVMIANDSFDSYPVCVCIRFQKEVYMFDIGLRNEHVSEGDNESIVYCTVPPPDETG